MRVVVYRAQTIVFCDCVPWSAAALSQWPLVAKRREMVLSVMEILSPLEDGKTLSIRTTIHCRADL